jgi:hypothetical protein
MQCVMVALVAVERPGHPLRDVPSAQRGHRDARPHQDGDHTPGWKRIMRSLTCLAAAAAATGALALIPLAAASPASAVAISTPVRSTVSDGNWAGYVDTVRHLNTMGLVYASFTVPKINCAKSVIGPHESSASYRKKHGNVYSAVSFWVGIDGKQGQNALEQAGITGICHSKTSAAVYHPFYQIAANLNEPGSDLPLSMGRPVRAGDVIEVSVRDDALGAGAPAGLKSGSAYVMRITDLTQYGEYWSGTEHTPARAPDDQAEVITEAVSGGPYVAKDAIGLAAFRPVTYNQAEVATFTSGGTNSLASNPFWTVQKYVVDGSLITTGSLGTNASGYSTFTNTFK